ncbi:RDD family protein [Streptomyces sp. NPDC020983]|uniref:RDD family protein n=1 Tax=Streptomyces sp. NPDC020983 TaxID=3365106 RepID=UPI0037B6CD56
MSAPPSGPSGPSGAAGAGGSSSPAPGYYPDPSIPNYIRYWNGTSWVPGTSRPAPASAAPAASSAPAPPTGPALDESGPVFLDADPTAPAAVQGEPEPAPSARPPAPAPSAFPAPPAPATGGPVWPGPTASRPPAAASAPGPAPTAPVWPAPAANPPGGGLPPISWGAPDGPRPLVPQPQAPEQPSWTTPSPVGPPSPAHPVAAPPAVPQQGPAPWAEQVQELARDGGAAVPWRPVAADPFASARGHDRPGGLWRRLTARLVDTVLFAAVTAVAAVPLGSAAYHHAKDKVDAARLTGETVRVWLLDATTGAEAGAVLLVALLAGVLLEVLPTARWGRTPGKKLMGLKVLDIEGQLPPSFGASLRRWALRSVLNALAVGVVGVAWVLFDRPWRQGWHDKASHTFVAAA